MEEHMQENQSFNRNDLKMRSDLRRRSAVDILKREMASRGTQRLCNSVWKGVVLSGHSVETED